MTEPDKLFQLQNILNARLPVINRWKKVEVYRKEDTFVIKWSEPKAKNIHPDETKEVPMSDINKVLKRNVKKLADCVEDYK